MASYKRIVCAIHWVVPFCHDIVRGVREFCLSKPDWLLHCPFYRQQGPAEPDHRSFDGIITSGSGDELTPWIQGCRKPIVSIVDLPLGRLRCRIERDEEGIGAAAAEHFLERGFTQFAYSGSTKPYSRRRLKGFASRLEQTGRSTRRLLLKDDNELQSDRVRGWLRSLPHPLGLFCSNDYWALELLNVLRLEGIRVPEEIAVMGVDDTAGWTQTSMPPLTSIAVPWRKTGFLAAHWLDRLMSGEKGPEGGRVVVPHGGVVVRQSTDINAVSEPDVAEALAYLHANACKGITVKEILQVCPIERRRLERACRIYLGRTPHEEIRRTQLERAKDLLVHTRMSLPEVVAETGMARQRFFLEFKARVGVTPRQYRAQYSEYRDEEA